MKGWSTSFALVGAMLVVGSGHAQKKTSPAPGVTLLEFPGRALAVADLCAPGVSMRATKYSERKATPQGWGSRADVGATIAANADFFDFSANGYTLVIGRARGAGEDWPANAQLKEKRWYWNFGARSSGVQKADTQIPNGMTDVVGAHFILYENDKRLPYPTTDPTINGRHRRTAYAIDKSHEHFLIFVSNTEFNGGEIVDNLISDAKAAGIVSIDTITLEDGGGSSQLYVKGRGQVITSGRLVNNHIGVIAKGSGPSPNCPNRKPAGILEAVSCDSIAGWATDVDTQPKAANVKFTFGGTIDTPGVIEQTVPAGGTGQCAPFGPCNYTFSAVPTDQIFDGVQRDVHAYVLDSEGGPSGELVNSPRIIKCDPKPQAPVAQPQEPAAAPPTPAQSLLPIEGDEGCSVGRRSSLPSARWISVFGLIALGSRLIGRRRR